MVLNNHEEHNLEDLPKAMISLGYKHNQRDHTLFINHSVTDHLQYCWFVWIT